MSKIKKQEEIIKHVTFVTSKHITVRISVKHPIKTITKKYYQEKLFMFFCLFLLFFLGLFLPVFANFFYPNCCINIILTVVKCTRFLFHNKLGNDLAIKLP